MITHEALKNGRGTNPRERVWNESEAKKSFRLPWDLATTLLCPPPPFPPAQPPVQMIQMLAREQGAQVTAPPTPSSPLRSVLQWARGSGAAMKDPVASSVAAVGVTKWMGTCVCEYMSSEWEKSSKTLWSLWWVSLSLPSNSSILICVALAFGPLQMSPHSPLPPSHSLPWPFRAFYGQGLHLRRFDQWCRMPPLFYFQEVWKPCCWSLASVELSQFSSVTQSCPTICDPRHCSTPGLPVHHQLPEFTQTHAHWVSDAPNHLILCRPLLFPPSIFPSIRVFSNESTLCMKWPKYCQLQHQSFQWTHSTDL